MSPINGSELDMNPGFNVAWLNYFPSISYSLNEVIVLLLLLRFNSKIRNPNFTPEIRIKTLISLLFIYQNPICNLNVPVPRFPAMNCEACQLKELVLEPFEIREVLRCILHTIAFHRALGLVRPKDVDCELFEITYVQCGVAELEKKIEEKIDQFIGWVEKHSNRKSQVSLSFYEVKNKQPTWFSNKIERLYWEQWHINLHVVTSKTHGKSHHSKATAVRGVSENALEETSSRRAALETALREVLFQIIKFVNEKKDHIPSISNSEVIFPYEITIPSSSDSSFGWNTDVLKRMLQTGHPTMLS